MKLDTEITKLSIYPSATQAAKIIIKQLKGLGMKSSLAKKIAKGGVSIAKRQGGRKQVKGHVQTIKFMSKMKSPKRTKITAILKRKQPYKKLTKGETIYNFQRDFNLAVKKRSAVMKSKAKPKLKKQTGSKGSKGIGPGTILSGMSTKKKLLSAAAIGATGLTGLMMLKPGGSKHMVRRSASNTMYSLDHQLQDVEHRRQQLPYYSPERSGSPYLSHYTAMG